MRGRPLQYVFEDSRADLRQTVAIARKFASDPKIVVEVGDFSGTASMAAASRNSASPTRTRSSRNAATSYGAIRSGKPTRSRVLAKYGADLRFRPLAALYLNIDWGRASRNILGEAAKLALAGQIRIGGRPDIFVSFDELALFAGEPRGFRFARLVEGLAEVA